MSASISSTGYRVACTGTGRGWQDTWCRSRDERCVPPAAVPGQTELMRAEPLHYFYPVRRGSEHLIRCSTRAEIPCYRVWNVTKSFAKHHSLLSPWVKFNRVWRVTKSSAKHQSLLSPWVMQHQPWPSPSAWTKTRSLHGCRIFYLFMLHSLSFSLSLSLSLLLLTLDRTNVCSPLLRLFPTQFRAKMDFLRKKNTFCVVTVTLP